MAVAAQKYPGIPEDFPIQPIYSALAGVQPKVSAVLSGDGNYYLPGTSPEEVQDDFEICISLLQHMVVYCKRKEEAALGTPETILQMSFEKFVREDFCPPAQARWIFDKLAQELGWPPLVHPDVRNKDPK